MRRVRNNSNMRGRWWLMDIIIYCRVLVNLFIKKMLAMQLTIYKHNYKAKSS